MDRVGKRKKKRHYTRYEFDMRKVFVNEYMKMVPSMMDNEA
jgi:hypothetical protein